MFTDAVLFVCPFCREPEGEIFVDVEACLDRRLEDPDPVCLRDGALDHPQDMLRFGYRTDRRVPCPHLVYAHGEIAWYGEDDDAPPKWEVEFDWTPPRYKKTDRGIGVTVMGDPEQLAELGAALKPRVEVAFDRPAFSWDALASFRNSASIYRVDAVFVAASRPLALRAAVKARVKEIKAFGKKLKGLKGHTGGTD